MRNPIKAAYRKFAPASFQERINRIRAPEAWAIYDARLTFIESERQRLFQIIEKFASVNRPINGYYMEFGCHTARTMRYAWRHFGQFGWSFLAFDSFEGLPASTAIDEQEIWGAGKYATSEEEFSRIVIKAGMPRDRLQTIKGFYDESLTPALAQKLLPTKAAVVFVDADLYESAVPVLRFARQFLQVGTVIVFDDWDCFLADPERGERRAWAEFLAVNPELRFEEIGRISMSIAFACVRV
jgi:O-methyltransferase